MDKPFRMPVLMALILGHHYNRSDSFVLDYGSARQSLVHQLEGLRNVANFSVRIHDGSGILVDRCY